MASGDLSHTDNRTDEQTNVRKYSDNRHCSIIIIYSILSVVKGLASYIPRLSPLFEVMHKEGESLVYFDHVLDIVGHGYHLALILPCTSVQRRAKTHVYG